MLYLCASKAMPRINLRLPFLGLCVALEIKILYVQVQLIEDRAEIMRQPRPPQSRNGF